ncbi:MAG: DNA-directed RNA polymerase subunit omega [Desulfobulbaceae bacterium S3730MH12]|nr:MAG: DNA-directed RNA polymerase subunit omega [Desulfobulbaceae bacterium S3730MH12]OEU82854.1 MAG: DNA-directed RNA polymerase subunit omega [Desulfobulbaceae bacterium C00003063]
MARITCEDCLEQVGDDNRFNLIHLTIKRIKQHRHGEPFLVEGKNKEIVMTLREIAADKVRFDNIDELPDLGKDEEVEETELESEA